MEWNQQISFKPIHSVNGHPSKPVKYPLLATAEASGNQLSRPVLCALESYVPLLRLSWPEHTDTNKNTDAPRADGMDTQYS